MSRKGGWAVANLGQSLEAVEGLASVFPKIFRAGPIALKFRCWISGVIPFFPVRQLKINCFAYLSILDLSQVAHGGIWVCGSQLTVRSSHSQKNRHSWTVPCHEAARYSFHSRSSYGKWIKNWLNQHLIYKTESIEPSVNQYIGVFVWNGRKRKPSLVFGNTFSLTCDRLKQSFKFWQQ